MLNKIKEWSGVIALIAIVLFLIFGGKGSSVRLGGVTNYDEVDASALKIGGSSASRFSLIKTGTCDLTSNSSITATTTGSATCATTGSLAGDVVIVGPLATTTTKITAQYEMLGAVAGTDTTTVTLLNLTGGNATPGSLSGFGSSTPYQIFRTTSSVPGL